MMAFQRAQTGPMLLNQLPWVSLQYFEEISRDAYILLISLLVSSADKVLTKQNTQSLQSKHIRYCNHQHICYMWYNMALLPWCAICPPMLQGHRWWLLSKELKLVLCYWISYLESASRILRESAGMLSYFCISVLVSSADKTEYTITATQTQRLQAWIINLGLSDMTSGTVW